MNLEQGDRMKKDKFSISMDEKLTKWIDKMVEEKKFATRSHAIEYAINFIKNCELPLSSLSKASTLFFCFESL